jgi:raffinose/stachyose/melibiose transport system permease protein
MTAVAVRRGRRTGSADYVRVGLWIALIIATLIWISPLVFILFASLKPPLEVNGTPAFTPPSSLYWANWGNAFVTGDLGHAALNSLIIAGIKVPLGLLLSALAAYALARIPFRRRRLLLVAITIGSMVPVQVAIGPLFRLVLDLGLLDSYAGVILPYIAFGLPYSTFILYNFFRALPFELDESARVDGASSLRIFAQIILPLSLPPLAALFILDFVGTWNEYGIALVILQSADMRTVPLAIQNFQTSFTSDYGAINAFTLLSMLPVLIVYLLFQRAFVSGLSAGAVKG